jgi:phage terminase Nu1 subunit (DNA packaging protein)
MMSIADIAKHEGVKKPGVSRRVKQLRKSGLQVELDGQGRVSAVNFAQYQELKGRYGDPSKAQAPGPSIEEPANESLEEARRQLTWIEAERAKLKLEAEQKLYVKVEDLEFAVDRVGEAIVQTVDQLIQSADDLAAAVAQHGVHGLRSALKKLAGDMKTGMADSMRGLLERPS